MVRLVSVWLRCRAIAVLLQLRKKEFPDVRYRRTYTATDWL